MITEVSTTNATLTQKARIVAMCNNKAAQAEVRCKDCYAKKPECQSFPSALLLGNNTSKHKGRFERERKPLRNNVIFRKGNHHQPQSQTYHGVRREISQSFGGHLSLSRRSN